MKTEAGGTGTDIQETFQVNIYTQLFITRNAFTQMHHEFVFA